MSKIYIGTKEKRAHEKFRITNFVKKFTKLINKLKYDSKTTQVYIKTTSRLINL